MSIGHGQATAQPVARLINELARLMLSLDSEEIPAVTALLRELATSDNGLGNVVEACYARWAELQELLD